MGAFAAINRVMPVTVPLVAPQYEHALILVGSVLFRSFAGSLTYDIHVEGNALLFPSSRWIILRYSKTCQARLDLDVMKHLKRECLEDRF